MLEPRSRALAPWYHHVARWLLTAVLAAALACSSPPPSPAPGSPESAAEAAPGVAAEPALRERLGIALEPLAAASLAPSLEGFGSVLAAEPLADLDAELATAHTALAASQASRERAAALYEADQAGSLANLEAARRQEATDAAQLERAERRLALAWGPASPFRDEAERRRWLARLTAGRAVLARLQLPPGVPAGALHFAVEPLSGQASWTAEAVWPAPAEAATALLPGPSYLALLAGPHLPQPGERLRVRASGGQAASGVLVPETAVVIAEGAAWAYVEVGGRWLRRPVDLAQPLPGGYFQAAGFAVGEPVVGRGAGLLLALEAGAAQPESGGEED